MAGRQGVCCWVHPVQFGLPPVYHLFLVSFLLCWLFHRFRTFFMQSLGSFLFRVEWTRNDTAFISPEYLKLTFAALVLHRQVLIRKYQACAQAKALGHREDNDLFSPFFPLFMKQTVGAQYHEASGITMSLCDQRCGFDRTLPGKEFLPESQKILPVVAS
jgi:hypothetical protein